MTHLEAAGLDRKQLNISGNAGLIQNIFHTFSFIIHFSEWH